MKDPVLIKTFIYFAILAAIIIYIALEKKDKPKK